MLPKSVALRFEAKVLHWKNTSFRLTLAEAQAVSSWVLHLTEANAIEVLVVDNRRLRGTWPSDVAEVSSRLMQAIYPHLVACVTLAEPISVLQVNRLSTASGTIDKIRAFSDLNEALDFIDDLCWNSRERLSQSGRSSATLMVAKVCDERQKVAR